MKIESSDQTIADLFNAGYFVVPRFQRPYSWDRENVTEFWDDVVRNNPSDYFIGSMVTYKIRDRRFGIVDGQQRLTTVTILLCVLRDILNEEQETSLAKGLHNLIERPNINNQMEFVLQTESSYPFLQDHIQKFGDPELEATIHKEEKYLAAAYDEFKRLVSSKVTSVKSDSTIPEKDVAKSVTDVLTKIRDSLLSLKVIFVQLDDEDDAYIIFETLNTRGKDLGLADLVKNHFTRMIRSKNATLDQAKDKWQGIRETIEGAKIDLSTDTFIHHYWLSRYEYIPAKGVFKSFKKRVSKGTAKSELSAMAQDSKYYRAIHDVVYGKWSKQEDAIAGSLSALLLFRVRQPVPCVLSLVRAYRDGVIKKKVLQSGLLALENFHFQFTAITSQRSSGGISGMYASFARRIFAAQDGQEVADIIKEIRGKLSERLPSSDEFIALFPELLYTNTLSKQRGLVKYVLVKLAKADETATSSDWEDLTIEHLVPQSKIGSPGFVPEVIGQLGNLLLVPESLNGKLGEKDFVDKVGVLQEAGYKLDTDLMNAKEWTPERIRARTSVLARKSCEEVWRI